MGPDGMSVPQEYRNFFISYTGRDRQWAEWIAMQLEQEDYTLFIQAWDFRPGSNFVAEMDRASRFAERTLLILSSAYLQSDFAFSEWATAFRHDSRGTQGKLLPMRIESCNVEGLLGQVIYIDLVSLEEEQARERLLAGVRRERSKPATVAFPQTHRSHPAGEGPNEEKEQGAPMSKEALPVPVQAWKKAGRPVPFSPVWNIPYR